MCTLFSHTFFSLSAPARKDHARDHFFRFTPPTLYKRHAHALQHRRRPTNSPSSISQSRRGSYEIRIIEKCKATFDIAFGAAYLFDDFQLAEYTDQRFDRTIHLFGSVRSHQRNAHERIGGMASRRHNGVDEDTGFESHRRCGKRLFQVTHIERDDRALCVANFEALFFEALQRIVGHLPKRFEAFGLSLQNAKCFERTCR